MQHPDDFPGILERGDRCDMVYDRGWWDMTVSGIHTPQEGGETVYTLAATHYTDVHDVNANIMRPLWVWKHGQWSIAYNSKARKVQVISSPIEAPRRPEIPTLPEGILHLAFPEEANEPAVAARAQTRAVDSGDGYQPPEARPSSFAEGTRREGPDGRTWVVVTTGQGSSIWSLQGQADFFIERARKEMLEKKERRKREVKAAEAAKNQSAKVAAAATPKGGKGKPQSLVNKDTGNVECAMDVVVLAAQQKKSGKGQRDRGALEHDRILMILGTLISTHGEAALEPIKDESLELSDSSTTGYTGVTPAPGPSDSDPPEGFDVQVAGRDVGTVHALASPALVQRALLPALTARLCSPHSPTCLAITR